MKRCACCRRLSAKSLLWRRAACWLRVRPSNCMLLRFLHRTNMPENILFCWLFYQRQSVNQGRRFDPSLPWKPLPLTSKSSNVCLNIIILWIQINVTRENLNVGSSKICYWTWIHLLRHKINTIGTVLFALTLFAVGHFAVRLFSVRKFRLKRVFS